MPQNQRATADTVARAAQVSRVAVARALNPEAWARARILQVDGELNYTPDRAARALATRRSHLDLAERVRALVRLIRRRLRDPSAPVIEETIQTSLVVRGTVG